MRVNVKMSGVKMTQRQIEQFTDDKINRIKQIVAESAYAIEADAITNAPVSNIDGGNLQNSIDTRFKDNGMTAEVFASAEYAVYVEFGTGIYAVGGKGRQTPWIYFDEKLGRFVWTHGMLPQPFLHPAWEKERPIFERSLRKEVE